MRLNDRDDKVLLLGSQVLLNALPELSKFDLWALSDTSQLVLVIDGPLSVVLDPELRDLHGLNLDSHDAAHGIDVELVDLYAGLLLWLDNELIQRSKLLVVRVIQSILSCLSLLLLEVEQGQDTNDVKGNEER